MTGEDKTNASRKHRYELTADTSTCVTIVEAVADRKGVGPLELSEGLHSVIDVDALERLVASALANSSDGGPFIQFRFCDCSVRVRDGWVEIDD